MGFTTVMVTRNKEISLIKSLVACSNIYFSFMNINTKGQISDLISD